RRDAGKGHRERPRFGVFLAVFAPEGVVRPSDVDSRAGLCFIREDGSWAWHRYPTRRAIDRTHEFMLLAKVADGEAFAERIPEGPAPLKFPTAAIAGTRRKVKRDPVKESVLRELSDAELSAAALVRLLGLSMTAAALVKKMERWPEVANVGGPGGEWALKSQLHAAPVAAEVQDGN